MSELLGGALDFIGNIMTNAFNAANVSHTNTANRRMVAATNEANQRINEQNISFQQQENEIARRREDNAVQRRAQDLMAAGLSKTLAAGSPAAANAMQAGQATIGMQHSTDKPFQAEAFKGWETAMNHKKQNEINELSLEITADELALKRDQLEEDRRHNKAMEEENTRHNTEVEEENKRYHDLQDKWENAKLDQNSVFHEDAMTLSWAEYELENNKYLTDAEQKEYQNLWYSTQIELAKNEDERAAARLTADLAESSAKVALYASEMKVNEEQAAYIRNNSRFVATQIVTEMIKQGKLKAESKQIMIQSLCDMWDLSMAINEGTPVGGSVPSQTSMDFTATQNALDRSATAANNFTNVVAKIFQTVAMIFVGSKVKLRGI